MMMIQMILPPQRHPGANIDDCDTQHRVVVKLEEVDDDAIDAVVCIINDTVPLLLLLH